jgi:hypothetical protein
MTPDEKKRILLLAEQVAGIDPTLGYWLAHHAEATRNEGRATLSPICFHLFERVGRTPPEECICGGGTIMGSPWADAEPPAAAGVRATPTRYWARTASSGAAPPASGARGSRSPRPRQPCGRGAGDEVRGRAPGR